MKKLSLLALVFLCMGCTDWYHSMADRTDKYSYGAGAYTALNIETENGQIVSSVEEGDSIYIDVKLWATGRSDNDAEAHINDITVHETIDTVNNSLRIFIDIPENEPRSYGGDVTVTLPSSIALILESSNGNISVDGHQANVDIYSANGEVEVSDTKGIATISTDNGKITVSRHTGNITATTSNGEIVADVIMPVTEGSCRFETSNENVTLAVPDSVGAGINLKTSNGTISVTGLELTDTNDDPDIFEAIMGDGSGTIELETSNGNVVLKKL